MKKTSSVFGKIDAVLSLSDTHCGSDFGLMPPPGSFTEFDGAKNTQNPLQKLMWNIFVRHQREALAKLKGRRFLLILDGDLTEGVHHHSKEADVEVENHKRCAIYCLKPLANAAIKSGGKVIVIEGTECHTERHEERIARELGAVTHIDDVERFTFDSVDVDVDGRIINVTHHVPPTIRPYLEASGLGIQKGTNVQERSRAGLPQPQVYIVAHRHRVGAYMDNHSLIVCNGAYQFKTRHGNKVVPGAITCPSMTILHLASRALDELPFVDQISTSVTQHQTLKV